MHFSASEARAFIITLKPFLKDLRDREVAIFPQFTAIAAVSEELRDPNITCGGQDLYWEAQGPYTGEVSASSLADLGCVYVLVGHSERRRLFGETDETCRLKVRAALNGKLIPVLCIGETLEEREANNTKAVLERQIRTALADVKEQDTLVLAYEPVWAIGTGRNAAPEQAQEIHAWARELLGHIIGSHGAQETRILYGGSVSPTNIDALMAQPDVDGVLVGGASLDIKSFGRIVWFRKTPAV